MAKSDEPPEEVRERFGEALRASLRIAGLTQDDLADKLGRAQSAVSAWVLGRATPKTPADTFDIERAVGVEPGSLSSILGYLPIEAVKMTSGFRRSLIADPTLSEDDKEILVAVYDAAVRRNQRRRKLPKR